MSSRAESASYLAFRVLLGAALLYLSAHPDLLVYLAGTIFIAVQGPSLRPSDNAG